MIFSLKWSIYVVRFWFDAVFVFPFFLQMEDGLSRTLMTLFQIQGWRAGTQFSKVWINSSWLLQILQLLSCFIFHYLDCCVFFKGFWNWSRWMQENSQDCSQRRTLISVNWSEGFVYSVPYFVMFKIQNKSIYVKYVGEKICFWVFFFACCIVLTNFR